ncbi:ATP synthase subunit gamma, mitochondrial-like [Cydia splendana]|uniref:ATP synthase subunit gamma, mitochondrial-like n=1 Tax=Cydia splendana TaxID=1100963 RepID=UPI0021237E15
MVQLKQVSLRLKSIKNIQKITKTMKMVSASKFTRAERELRAARPFGYAPRKFYESSKLVAGPVDATPGEGKKAASEAAVAPEAAAAPDQEADKKLRRVYIAVTSDRGLCGGVHSGVARRIRRDMIARNAEGANHKIFAIGDKSRSMLRRQFGPNMIISIKDIGRQTPVFADASLMAAALSDSGYVYDIGDIYYNKFYSAVKYELNVIPIFNKDKVETAPNMNAFDDVDAEQLESYTEWTLAALLYYALKESAASEQSARMSAMDNATKNASEMIRKLTLIFNRTRQSVITRELIEIISGAAALE